MAARGLIPKYHGSGGCIRYSANVYTVASGYATSLFKGDLVALTADGSLIQAVAGSQQAIVGVFAGCSYRDAQGAVVYSPFWPANTTATEIRCNVYNDKDIFFEVEADQVGTALTAANIGQNVDLTNATGSTLFGESRAFVDSSVAPTAAVAQLKIVGSGEDGVTEFQTFTGVGTPMKLIVKINEHNLSDNSAGKA